ncbi:MAG: PKD domain-containing protein, partial [Bacteroidota bacterium]
MLSSTNVNVNLSLNFLPPINCFQPREVNNIAAVDQIGGVQFTGGIILVTTSVANVEVEDDNGAVVLPAPTPVPGRPAFSSYRIDGLTGRIRVTSDGALQVGVFGQSGARGWAGYYAGFPTDVPFLTELGTVGTSGDCTDGTTLFVIGGNYDKYLWYQDGEFLLEETVGSLFTGPFGGGEFAVKGVLDGCGESKLSTSVVFECPDSLVLNCPANTASVWVRPESQIGNNGQLVSWRDTSGNQTLAALPFMPRNPANLMQLDQVENFYPTVGMDGNKLLETGLLNSSLLRKQDEISMFAVFKSNNDGLVFSQGNFDSTQIALGGTKALLGDNDNPLLFNEAVGQELSIVGAIRNGTSGEAYLNGLPNGVNILGGEDWINTPLAIGGQISVGNLPEALFDGHVAEIIMFPYSQNQEQREKTQTYLGLKYGFSLPHTFISSSGDVLYDLASQYANDIAGIGKDDCSGLDHKQSKSRNASALVTVGLGELYPLNNMNPNTFTMDYEYAIWGHDMGTLEVSRSITGNDSVGCLAMGRTWHMTEPLEAVAQLTLSIPDTLGVSFLVVSDDPNFSNGDESYIRLEAGQNADMMAAHDFSASQYFTFAIELAMAEAGADTSACLGDTVGLAANDGRSYIWSTNSTNLISNDRAQYPLVTVNEMAYMYVAVTDMTGCTNTDSVLVTPLALPAIDAGVDQTLCLGEETLLTASGGESYVWQPNPVLSSTNVGDPIVSPTETNVYIVEGTGANGCKANDSVQVQVNQLPIIQIADSVSVCEGQEAILSASANTPRPLVWSNGEEGEAIFITSSSSQRFNVIATSQLGCVDSASVYLNVTPLARAAFTVDNSEDVEELTANFTNLSENADSYIWKFGDRTTSGQENPTHTYEQTGEFEVELIALSEGGCSDSTSFGPLEVKKIQVFTPTAFSPNGDGINDEYTVVTLGVKDILFQVYSRWGMLVYESRGDSVNWDGNIEGELIPEGVYTVKVSATSAKKEKPLEAFEIITILR